MLDLCLLKMEVNALQTSPARLVDIGETAGNLEALALDFEGISQELEDAK